MPATKDPTVWKTSAARDFLFELVSDENFPGPKEIKPRKVFDDYCKDRPEFQHFQDYTAIKFADKLRQARTRANKKKDRATEDAEFLAHDRLIFPEPTITIHGEPKWKGSNAHKLLIQDIKDGKHKTMKPRLLYELREEYQDYDPDRFRNRIYQEVKAIKREEWVKQKEADKQQKKK